MLQKLIASSLFLASLLFGQEPSAFNAGGSTSPKSESQIINEKLFNLSNRVQVVEESQEGLKSIFEGQIQKTLWQHFKSYFSIFSPALSCFSGASRLTFAITYKCSFACFNSLRN